MANVILFNKPYKVLSQFTPEQAEQITLTDYLTSPETRGFYPAGRLDYDSEGLLLLTNDGALQHRIASPSQKLAKTYWVQVEGEPSIAAVSSLAKGIMLKDGKTRPAKVKLMDTPSIWPRKPPIRHREHVATHWLEITLTEGRNRQVRRMTAAVERPTLRLIRVQIGQWPVWDLAPGQFKAIQVNLPSPSPKRTKPKSNRRTK